MVGGPPNKFSAFDHFQVPIYGKNMNFCQKMAEKNSLKIFDVFLPKNSIPGAKNSLT